MFSPNISVYIFYIFLKIYFKYRYELLIIFLTIRLFYFLFLKGIPQRLVLGPLLFILDINNLGIISQIKIFIDMSTTWWFTPLHQCWIRLWDIFINHILSNFCTHKCPLLLVYQWTKHHLNWGLFQTMQLSVNQQFAGIPIEKIGFHPPNLAKQQ